LQRLPYQEKAVAEILKAGARFLGLAPKSLADVYGDIAAIAGIMGAREEGVRVIEKMRDAIDLVRKKPSVWHAYESSAKSGASR